MGGSDYTPVAVLGAFGKMGRIVCAAVRQAPDLKLVAELGRNDPRRQAAPATVIVDFTHPDAVMNNIRWGLEHGKHLVIGTSGIDDTRLKQIRDWLTTNPDVGIFVIANFSLSALLARNFATEAAPHFESVEILEFAHADKADAPSGTALETARAIATARTAAQTAAAPHATTLQTRGARSARSARSARNDEIPVHLIRLTGLVSHQEVLLWRNGEAVSIRFDTIDRSAYLPGILRAIRQAATHPGLHLGLGSLYEM